MGASLLWAKLKPDLETGNRWDAYMLQRDAVPAAVEMPWCGIGIDTVALDVQIAAWSVALATARAN